MMRTTQRIPTIKNWSSFSPNLAKRKSWIGIEAVIDNRKKLISPKKDAEIS